MNKDIMDCIDVGTGPVTLDVVMAKELAWSREDIELASKMITTLVRGIGMTIAFRTGRGCEHCGRLQAAPGLDDCGCMPARSGGAPVRHPTLRAQDEEPALGWCGNCGNCNDDEATSCKGCGSELTPVADLSGLDAVLMGAGFEVIERPETLEELAVVETWPTLSGRTHFGPRLRATTSGKKK
jgi:hypothetical protein